jgi:hypothetical protein
MRLPNAISRKLHTILMFPSSSSRFKVKLRLVVINHLEVEMYGGDEA